MILRLLFALLLTVLPVQASQPVSMEILFDGVPALGGGWVLTVTMKAETDILTSQIELVHSDGLRVDAGLGFWKGPLSAEQETVLEIAYTLVDKPPQDIIVNINGQTTEGHAFQMQERRVIDLK